MTAVLGFLLADEVASRSKKQCSEVQRDEQTTKRNDRESASTCLQSWIFPAKSVLLDKLCCAAVSRCGK